jgi:chromosome segregation ATPase
VSVEAELEAEKRKIQEMTEQRTRLASESAELKRFGEQETRLRTALEAQLRADQERIRQLTSQIAELQNEQLQLETKLQEERDSAARGMELLFTVQEKLSSVFKALGADGQNGHHSQAAVDRDIRQYR